MESRKTVLMNQVPFPCLNSWHGWMSGLGAPFHLPWNSSIAGLHALVSSLFIEKQACCPVLQSCSLATVALN